VRTRLRFSLAAAALIAGALTPGVHDVRAQSQDASFTLAVLRRDGVLIPFASLDNGKWTNRWPEPGRRVDIPILVDESPRNWWLGDRPVTEWTARTTGGLRSLHVKSPLNFAAQCERHIGLQTDYSSTEPPVPRDMQPYPKDGLATSGSAAIEPIDVLDSQSPDRARLLAALTDPFNKAEAKLAARSQNPRVKEISPEKRASTPVTIEVLFRSPGRKPGTTVWYFEAVKRYGRPRPIPPAGFIDARVITRGRDPLFYGAGWGLADANGDVTVTLTADESDSDREGLLYALPLGRFSVGDRRYWVLQRSGWGFERYEIVELDEPEPRLAFKTSGGVCR
jgi:hypothetical protein